MMKRSNVMVAGAGIFLVVLLLASVITARVIFDRSIVQRSPDNGIYYVQTDF